jgi:SET domain-containing protein
MGLMIRSSAIHAAGCYTTSAIRKRARVVEYTGPRIQKAEADRLYEDSPITYLFGIGSRSTVIDGHGAAMFLNHSCDPNCETDEIGDRVWILALRDIAPGEELTYDYNLYDGELRRTELPQNHVLARRDRPPRTRRQAEEEKLAIIMALSFQILPASAPAIFRTAHGTTIE